MYEFDRCQSLAQICGTPLVHAGRFSAFSECKKYKKQQKPYYTCDTVNCEHSVIIIIQNDPRQHLFQLQLQCLIPVCCSLHFTTVALISQFQLHFQNYKFGLPIIATARSRNCILQGTKHAITHTVCDIILQLYTNGVLSHQCSATVVISR